MWLRLDFSDLVIAMGWNYWEQKPTPGLANPNPNPTHDYRNAMNTIEKLDTLTGSSYGVGLKNFQSKTFGAYNSEIRKEIDDKTMNELEHEFKQWLCGDHLTHNDNRLTAEGFSLVENTARVMEIKNPSKTKKNNYMSPNYDVDVQHTPWGNQSMTYLPGVRQYMMTEQEDLVQKRVKDALLLDQGPQDLDTAWEYFIKFVKNKGTGPHREWDGTSALGSRMKTSKTYRPDYNADYGQHSGDQGVLNEAEELEHQADRYTGARPWGNKQAYQDAIPAQGGRPAKDPEPVDENHEPGKFMGYYGLEQVPLDDSEEIIRDNTGRRMRPYYDDDEEYVKDFNASFMYRDNTAKSDERARARARLRAVSARDLARPRSGPLGPMNPGSTAIRATQNRATLQAETDRLAAIAAAEAERVAAEREAALGVPEGAPPLNAFDSGPAATEE